MGTNLLVNVSQENNMTMTLFQNVNIAALKKKNVLVLIPKTGRE